MLKVCIFLWSCCIWACGIIHELSHLLMMAVYFRFVRNIEVSVIRVSFLQMHISLCCDCRSRKAAQHIALAPFYAANYVLPVLLSALWIYQFLLTAYILSCFYVFGYTALQLSFQDRRAYIEAKELI